VGYVYSDANFEDYNLSKIAGDLGPGVTISSPNNIADAGNPEGKFDGNQMPLSAEHSAVWSVRYETAISNQLRGFTELNGSYQSKRYLTAGNRSYLPSYDLWNLSVGADAESWRVILYVDNLFDDDTIRSGLSNTDYGFLPDIGAGGFAIPDAVNLILPQPRTFGARATYRF
jgi:iron complex outermembrane receptor protein